MNDTDTNTTEAPTRRDCLKYGGTVVVGGLLAGCSGQSGGETTQTRATDTETPTETSTETPTPEERSYTVELAPIGDVTFEVPPENVFTVFPWYADMALALGHGDSINSMWWGQGFGSIMNYFASALDGISVEWADLSGSYGASLCATTSSADTTSRWQLLGVEQSCQGSRRLLIGLFHRQVVAAIGRRQSVSSGIVNGVHSAG